MFAPEQHEHTAIADEGNFKTDPGCSEQITNVGGKVRSQWLLISGLLSDTPASHSRCREIDSRHTAILS